MVMIEPFESPPRVATFSRGIGEPEPEGDHWETFKDIDMCGQGDTEIIHDWKNNYSIK